jgi:catechol 2,3-dioxygenase-like lactoylglutathione lyase family enzyme
MKLVKTLELPGGGQHFFLDMGNGVDGIAFFWFPEAPEGTPGDSLHPSFDDQMRRIGDGGGGMTAIGTMNHIAFDVPAEKIDEYLVKLRGKGVAVTEIVNHSNSLQGGHKRDYDPETNNGDVFVRSLYFKDPNGTLLEFACWTTTFDESDIRHEPAHAIDKKVSVSA